MRDENVVDARLKSESDPRQFVVVVNGSLCPNYLRCPGSSRSALPTSSVLLAWLPCCREPCIPVNLQTWFLQRIARESAGADNDKECSRSPVVTAATSLLARTERACDNRYLLEGVQLLLVLCTQHYSVNGNEAYLLYQSLTDNTYKFHVGPLL